MDLSNATIAVTGATGFLGRYISVTLTDLGSRVVGVVRDPSRRPELAQKGVEFRIADLQDKPALIRAFEGADAIVACAGLIPHRRESGLFEVNAKGTENVLKAAKQAGVKRIVHVSSVAVYRHHWSNVSEEGKLVPNSPRYFLLGGGYMVSKKFAEQVTRRLAEEYALQLTIVRPGQLYGAFDTFLPFIRRLLLGRIAIIPIGFRIPIAYGGDAARAISRCLSNDNTIGKTYNLTGPDRPFTEFIKAWQKAGGAIASKALRIPLPVHFKYDSRLAIRDLGWSHMSFVDALRETFEIETASNS